MGASEESEAGLGRVGWKFWLFVAISQILGILCVVLVGVWLGIYFSGFGWTNRATLFNYHPLFLVLGLVFIYGEALLVYRVFRKYQKKPVKILHAVLHILALMFTVIGLRAIFQLREESTTPHLHSLHSWLGLVAVILFGLQWLAGLISFLVPQFPLRLRAKFLPIHVSFGSMLYLFITGVCITGITELNFHPPVYSTYSTSELLGNFVGLFIVLFAGVVFYIISQPAYRRVETAAPDVQIRMTEPKLTSVGPGAKTF